MRQRFDGFQVRAADDPASIIVVVLETTIGSWLPKEKVGSDDAAQSAAAALQSVTEQILVFINTFLLMHDANRVCILLSSPTACDLIYPQLASVENNLSSNEAENEDDSFDTSPNLVANRPLKDVSVIMCNIRSCMTTGIREQLEAQCVPIDSRNTTAALSAALARALCLLNRAHLLRARRLVSGHGTDISPPPEESEYETPSTGRVLAVVASSDNLAQYVSMMNCIFSAQRLGIPVDSCIVSHEDSTYFQQAAHLTNGVSVRVPRDDVGAVSDILLQTLQTVFLVDKQGRDLIAMPAPESVDFRASCMQTKKIIEEGYTCSVCLSTFDPSIAKGAAMCPVCNARFAVLGRSRRRPPRPV